ncbi:metal ABC transporter solute-binding protein, Zn/Mn family [Tsukamurella soli]|uniref:metal ABC transporter solute-binding protein, Zn/Mn family n=1 Tax=Tsukamurella soli TaxID=644556 RepID=UPI00361DE07C
MYGAIARAVAGDAADVRSLFTNPTGDPHEFEASAQDTLAVKRATLVVYNGGHYDSYIDSALHGTSVRSVDAFKIKFGTDDKPDVNEHVFYDLPTMKRVADLVAGQLGEEDAAHRADYTRRAQQFDAGVDDVIAQAEVLATKADGADVATTEPVADYLLILAGLTDATPARFTHAIEEGSDPAPADIAATTALITDGKVRALVLNVQTEDSVTNALKQSAETAKVPVVPVTETLPAGVTDYVAWQRGIVSALSTAVAPQAAR